MSELLHNIAPGNGTSIRSSTLLGQCSGATRALYLAHLGAAPDWTINPGMAASASLLNLDTLSVHFKAFKEQVLHPELQNEPVVRELLRAAGWTIYETHRNTYRLVARSVARHAATDSEAARVSNAIANTPPNDGRAEMSGQPSDLNYTHFESFAATLPRVMLEPSIAVSPAVPVQLGNSYMTASQVADQQTMFKNAFAFYFSSYFEGKYVDRFGKTLAQPTSLQTVSDNEIAGTVQVFLELMLDFAVQTPVWTDGAEGRLNYYPGSGADLKKTTPTVVTAAKMKYVPLRTYTLLEDSTKCGITALKAKAIQYVAQTAGNSASQLAGTVGGSFGGISVGLGVVGKLSIGDNKTIRALATTALQKVFTRIGEEASYRVLWWIPYTNRPTLAELVQKYLDAQLAGLNRLPESG